MTEFPHISLRACAFYIILLSMITNSVVMGELDRTTKWLCLIALILLQVFQEVWWLRHPNPRDNNE